MSRGEHDWDSPLTFGCSACSLLEYDTETGEVKVLLDQLRFPNGVQLSPAEDHVLVSETTMARIRRCVGIAWLSWPLTGGREWSRNNLSVGHNNSWMCLFFLSFSAHVRALVGSLFLLLFF